MVSVQASKGGSGSNIAITGNLTPLLTWTGSFSDIYLVSAGAPDYENRILKIHRLGRISFRAVKEKRDYTNKNANRQNFSWMFLSRLAAAKEYQFMQVSRTVQTSRTFVPCHSHRLFGTFPPSPLRRCMSMISPSLYPMVSHATLW